MNIDWPGLAAIIMAVGAIVIAYWKRGKDDADVNQAAAASVNLLLVPLNNRIEYLAERVEKLTANEQRLHNEREKREREHKVELDAMRTVQAAMQNELDELRAGVAVLVAQLEQAHITPRYRPKTGPLTGG